MPENENILPDTVFPSEEKTIVPRQTDDEYGGAHAYYIRRCKGFKDGETIYADTSEFVRDWTTIQFVQKLENGQVIPGLQNEQLIIVLKDRIKKLNAKFPHPENENMLNALDDFLEASERRIRERMDRGVMGELKK